jgi:hypothetical protein
VKIYIPLRLSKWSTLDVSWPFVVGEPCTDTSQLPGIGYVVAYDSLDDLQGDYGIDCEYMVFNREGGADDETDG